MQYGLIEFSKYKPQIEPNHSVLLENNKNTSEPNAIFVIFCFIWFGLGGFYRTGLVLNIRSKKDQDISLH